VSAQVGAGVRIARLGVDRRQVASGRVYRGRAVFRVGGRPRHVGVVVVRAGRRCWAAHDLWLLPRSARAARRERVRDARLSARLAALGNGFGGWSAFWVHDLRTGRTAGWNADALFPAASLVKLGVLVVALDRWGASPRDRGVAQEVRDLVVWSSTKAANHLTVRLGGGSADRGAVVVQERLHRLGAVSSTYTGLYREDSSVAAPLADAPRPPPFIAFRRTTAHDIGRVLYELHAGAVGNRLSLRRAGLSRHEARVALGLLLSSSPRGDNLGLFRPTLGPSLPMAQKHGWNSSVRHSAAVVYGPRGPTIVVLLTYRPGLVPSASVLLGLRFLRAAGLS
jgi:hypothetical protein